jgi:hypothetical protein
MRRDQLPPHRTATFVMPRHKAVYVWVNKAACTSIKWLVAELQGEDPERFYGSLSREVSRSMTIHRRQLWQHTPTAAELPDDRLAEISPDNGWFIFAAVRHPTARLFSGWQSKLLLREPSWVDRWADAPWFPRVPASHEELAEDWLRFARSVVAEPAQPIMRNRHFASQHRLLAADRMPYTRIYTTGEMGQLLEDFTTHLRTQGWEGELKLGRANETPLKPLASLFPKDVLDGMRGVYPADFEAFGYDDPMPPRAGSGDGYPQSALDEIARLVERSERINDVVLRARRFKREAGDAAARSNGHGNGAVSVPRILRAARRIAQPAPPPRLTTRYLDFLGRLHGVVEPAAYLEIGISHGDSLRLAACPAVGIDPAPDVRGELPEGTTVFEETSDEYFLRERPLEPLGGRRPELAFIDGMHLAEFALRDFINVEQVMGWTGVVVFDDVLPREAKIAARHRRTRTWTGDVFKLLGVLERHRPDLICLRVGTRPTGLLVVLGLDPSSRVLRDRYDEIAAELVTPDPQELPDDVLRRKRLVDPEELLAAPLWELLRTARANGVERHDGLRELRRAVRKDLSRGAPGRLRRLLPVGA